MKVYSGGELKNMGIIYRDVIDYLDYCREDLTARTVAVTDHALVGNESKIPEIVRLSPWVEDRNGRRFRVVIGDDSWCYGFIVAETQKVYANYKGSL